MQQTALDNSGVEPIKRFVRVVIWCVREKACSKQGGTSDQINRREWRRRSPTDGQIDERNAACGAVEETDRSLEILTGRNEDMQRVKQRSQADGQRREAECHQVIGESVLLACADQCLKREWASALFFLPKENLG